MKSKFVFKSLAVTLVFVLLMTLIACGAANTQSSTQGSSGSETTPSTQAQTTQVETKPVDPLGKYEPGITITCVRHVDNTIKYKEGESIDKNIYYDTFQNEFGINLVNKWVTDISQYANKLNVSIASNDLPDIIPLIGTEPGDCYKQLDMLVKSGSIMDLTGIYEKYASTFTKEVMSQDTVSFNSAKINGKLMAIPHITSALDSVLLLFVRMDWFKKLNMDEPKTFADVLKISEAFTTKDPDGNGKNDTFGIGASKDGFTSGFPTLQGVANAYHAYPQAWIKDESGNLSYGSILPQMKTVLQTLQELYKKGQLDKEFGVKDSNKLAESITSDKCGMFFGQMWNPLWPLQDLINKNPKAEWKAFPLPSIDDKPVNPQISIPITELFAVNKNCKYPEALVKIVNFSSIMYFDQKAAADWNAQVDARYGKGTDVNASAFKYNVALTEPAKKNLNEYIAVTDAIKANDPSKLDPEGMMYWDSISKYKKGDNSQWGYDKVFGEISSYSVINNEYVKKDLFIYNQFYGAPTPTMTSKWASLKKLEDETFLQIIMGGSIDEFDKFVTRWKGLGGDTITNEVNQWYQDHK